MRRCKPIAVLAAWREIGERSCLHFAYRQCQSGSDIAVVRSNSTGFARNLFWSRCDVRAFGRTSLRDAISSPAGFLPDLLLRFKKSARREGARDAENDKSSFHYRADFDRPSIDRLQAWSASRGSSATSKQAAFSRRHCSRKPSESLGEDSTLHVNSCL